MKLNKKAVLIWSILLIIAIVATVFILGKSKVIENNNNCCEKICGQFNQECRGWNQDTLECTFNYEQYGFPEISEVFTFKVNESMKERICYGKETINETTNEK